MIKASDNFDNLTLDGIKSLILPDFGAPSVSVYDTVASTNLLMKELGVSGAEHGDLIIASHQTCGRGRLGRSFFSPSASGIYMSILLRPSLTLSEATLITPCAAVAVCEAIESLSDKTPKIKWVNDIFIDGKKVCGILTESVFNGSGELDFCVLGIGINVYPPQNGFPEEINAIAASVFATSQSGLRERLAASVYNSFMMHFSQLTVRAFVPAYKERCFVLGKRINVLSPSGTRSALALDIDNDCRLLVRFDDGNTEYISSGEISIRTV